MKKLLIITLLACVFSSAHDIAKASYLDGCPGPWVQHGNVLECSASKTLGSPGCPKALLRGPNGCSGVW